MPDSIIYYTRLRVSCGADFTEILIAEIAEAGFDTFMETEDGFEAYAEMDRFDQAQILEIEKRYEAQTKLRFTQDRVARENWNEEWEKNYEPIIVDDRCLIRASFHHIDRKFPYEIVITPKMSFGTGHHQTTYLMVKTQMEIDHRNKRVMDAGCGTAILSIMACKLGAASVDAFDIDEWSMLNGRENADVNGCTNIRLQQGTISEVDLQGSFDIILANINKNVLLAEMKHYARHLKDGGSLLLSGFYAHDVDDLVAVAGQHGLLKVITDEREGWACLLLRKS